MDFDRGRPRYGRLAGVVAGVDVGPGVVDDQVAPRLAAAPPLRQDFDPPARVGRRVVRHNLHFNPPLKLNLGKGDWREEEEEEEMPRSLARSNALGITEDRRTLECCRLSSWRMGWS